MRKPLLFLLLAAAVSCNRNDGLNSGKPDRDLYSYVPSDASFIAGARLNHLRMSPIYASLRDRLPSEALPYEKEASEMVIASDGVHTLVLARGKFDKQRLERDLKGGQVEWVAPDLVAIGEKASVDSAKRRAGSPLTKQIPAADLWLVTNGRIPVQFPERSNLANLNRLAQDLQLGVVGFQISDAIEADAHFDFASEPASEQAQTALRGFIGLARLSTPNGQEQLLEVLDRIQVSRDKARVTLKADWPPKLVKTLLDTLPAAGTKR